MAEFRKIYKCEICGNIVEVLHSGLGTLNCCGKPMKELKENTVDAAKEKHIPVVEKNENGTLIKVGAAEHPMLNEHFIEWIEVQTLSKTYIKNLKPGEKPEAFFSIDEDIVAVKAYCNLHGLWKG